MLRLLSAAALLVVLAAGCGGSALPKRAAQGVPRALAQGWEDRAEAIAAAASAGNDCSARQLAVSLREDVIQAQRKVPRRLQGPLLSGVSSLVDHATCTPVATKKPQPPPKRPKPKPPKPPKKHGPHGHEGHGG